MRRRQLFLECLALRALEPFLGGCLVAADVDDLGGEDVHNLRQHILDKLIDALIADAEYIFIDTPVVPHLIWSSRTAQFRIAGEGCEHVSRHVDLRDDGDVPFLGISDDVAGFLLSVIAAIGDAVVDVGVGADDGA